MDHRDNLFVYKPRGILFKCGSEGIRVMHALHGQGATGTVAAGRRRGGRGGEEREERTLLFVRARLLDMADALCLRAQSISL